MNNNNQRQFQNMPTNHTGFNFDNGDTVQQPMTQIEADPQAYISDSVPKKKGKTKADRKLKLAGLVLAVLFVAVLAFSPSSPSVDTSYEAQQAVQTFVSTQLPIGTRVLSNDEILGGQDLTITHSSAAAENKIYIWDYAAEDGDYVQVFVDGVAICDPFMVKNKSVEFRVPTTGEIQVVGTRDGGGGITYAIHYDVNGTTYFNGTDVGSSNLYTLVRE